MAELADARDSKSRSFGSVGSIPSFGTQNNATVFHRRVFIARKLYHRPSLYNHAMTRLLFTLGLLVGLALGAYVGWVAAPVRYTDTGLAALAQPYKDEAVLMIAVRYSADENGEAAQLALAALGYADAAPAIRAITTRAIAARWPEADLRRLVALAVAFNAVSPEMTPYRP